MRTPRARPPSRLPPLAALAVAALALALVGCASPGTVPPQDAQGRYVIAMGPDLAFEPAEARVPLGATVTWVNNGTVPHDVAAYRPSGDGDRADWTSGEATGHTLIPPGGSVQFTFDEAGAWTIWCHTHHEERMTGTVHVQ